MIVSMDDAGCTVSASTAEELRSAWQYASRHKTTVINLEEGDYELPGPIELLKGCVTLRGPSSVSVTRRLLPWARRAACTVAAMAVGGLSWRSRVVSLSVVLLGSEWLYSSKRKLPGARKARIVARDGAFVVSGGELRLECISLASLGTRALVRCRLAATLRARDADLGCAGGNGVECENDATVFVSDCMIANCGRSGIALLGAGDCRLLARACSFVRNRRFGCELQGGRAAVITGCTFDDCGSCVSDREKWQPDSFVHVSRCLLRGCAACLPGLSVIGDSVPGYEAHARDAADADASVASQLRFDEDEMSTTARRGSPWKTSAASPRKVGAARAGESVNEDSVLEPVPRPIGIVFEECVVERVNGAGIYLLGRHTVRARACAIHDVAMAGIEALRGAHVRVSRSKIQRNHGGGIVLHRGARGTLSSCDLVANGGGGNCGIMDAASCRLRNCDISRACAIGIQVCKASVSVDGCRIERSGEAGIVVGGHDSRSCREARRVSGDVPPLLSKLAIRDSRVSGSGAGALFVAPHSTIQHHCYNESFAFDAVEHTIVAHDCYFADARQALRVEVPARGCLAGNDYDAPVSNDLTAWRGTTRMPWRCERVIHCAAGVASTSPFRRLKDPSLLRLIVEFAS
ncbi:hypothetical protein CTAYLR_005299 [Chrysophaeum taylorii]|uniref:Right handed beta helix domain-containing protein n=1 Tax=Chrysophaeum taylorii TaxID=2483200 RepID=A0AAD7UJS3_9STRA|nr:hypothetical protein CTAYLR_005299 [Chrysophaeum taylorii]